MKRNKKWTIAIFVAIWIMAVIALVAVLSHTVSEVIDDVRKEMQSSASTNIGGSASGGSTDGTSSGVLTPEEVVEPLTSFVMQEPRMGFCYLSDVDGKTQAHNEVIFRVHIPASMKNTWDLDNPTYYMFVAPTGAMAQFASEYNYENWSEVQWIDEFYGSDVPWTILPITSTSLFSEEIYGDYYELQSKYVISDQNVLVNYTAIAYVDFDNDYPVLDYAECHERGYSLAEIAMRTLNQHYYSEQMGNSLYDAVDAATFKGIINVARYADEYLTVPPRDTDGLSECFYTAVMKETLTLGVGQVAEVEYIIDPWEPYFGVPILLGDSTEYFTTKDGTITGVAACENVPLNVYICGQPYTIYVTVK